MSNLYRHADKAIKALYDAMEREFQNTSVTLRFDELNLIVVKDVIGELYKRIDRLSRQEFRKVAKAAYRDAAAEVGLTDREIENGFVNIVLAGFNPVTKYAYRNEWNRKRDRLTESLMSSRNRNELREGLRRALGLAENQVRQYADIVTDEARMRAFTDAERDRFKWHTQHDGHVCSVCEERDGQVYKQVDIPTKHHRCRCYLTAE